MIEHGPYYVGLDIGGTTIKSALINTAGEQVGAMVEVRSLVDEGYRLTFQQLEEAAKKLCDQAGIGPNDLGGVGLDVPAPSCDGVIWGKANLAQDWVGVNIREEFSRHIGLPVFLTNDGSAAAVGEYMLRPDYHGSLLFVAPGTGLAGGLILEGGAIYEGANGLSMEAGHISVPFMEEDGELPTCSCGWKGCLEAWVSLVALRRRVEIELGKDQWKDHPLNAEDSSIKEKAFKLRTLAEQGDELAIGIFKRQGYIFGYGLADMTRLLDPSLIVIGGGLAEAKFRDAYLDWILEGFKARVWPMYLKSPVEPAKVTTCFEWAIGGDAAAAIGMAHKARERFGGD